MITYPLEALFTSGVLMFLCQLGARRQIGLVLRSTTSAQSFLSLFGTPRFPHGDSLAYLGERVKVEELAEVPSRMAEQLIRRRVFEAERLLGTHYLVAIDGTGTFQFKQRHCEHCLTRTHANGSTDYFHNVLEAKLVTASGFCISLMTEFIDNRDLKLKNLASDDESKMKQDCELKAFYRLSKKLKNRFPRLKICLLLDALFANGKVFNLCRANAWTFLITLQDDHLRSINDEYFRLLKLHPENACTRILGTRKEITQNYTWMNDVEFVDTKKERHYLNVVECNEFKPGKDKSGNPIRIKTKFKWLTNFFLERNTITALSNQGGRQRWKIENQGFNVQKNGGYELEHAYSRDPNAFQAFYYLMQIAHTIAQLIQRGSLLKKVFPKGAGSHWNVAFLLLEAIRQVRITPAFLDDINRSRVQIRFDTS